MTTVLIAGGGIGGLALAASLRHHGLRAAVYERASSLAPVGAGITIQMNAVLALRTVGLDEDVLSEGHAPTHSRVLDARGRTLTALDLAAVARSVGASAVGLHRARLQAALRRRVDDDAVHLGRAVERFVESDDGVEITLSDGSTARGDVLVAADGLRSSVRAQLLGDAAPVYAGYTSWRGVAKGVRAVDRACVTETWGEGRRFGVVPIADDETYWFATANAPPGERDAPGAAKTHLLDLFGAWHAPIRALLEGTDDDHLVRTDIADRPTITRWVYGRVALLGDAAHPMTPNLGQGGGQAIEDAVVLAKLLATRPDVRSALAAYESARVGRANEVVVQARRLGRVGQIESAALRSVRDAVMRLVPASMSRRAIERAMRFSPV